MQQRAGQAQALGHAAREAGHQGVALVGQVDQLEHFLADLPPRGPLDPVGGGEELEILDHLHVVVDAEEVGHVADDAADLLGPGVDRVAADGRLAPGRVQERGEDPHRRRLARAVGADEAVDVPLVERQVEPVQGVELAVHLGQFMRLDHRDAPRSEVGGTGVVAGPATRWVNLGHARCDRLRTLRPPAGPSSAGGSCGAASSGRSSGGDGALSSTSRRAGPVDPGHEHRPLQGQLAGQVEVVERVVRQRRDRCRRRLAVVEHHGEHQVGAVDPELRSTEGLIQVVASACP